MVLKSTRNENASAQFKEAIFIGLAPDGGLYYPAEKIDFSDVYGKFDSTTPFNTIATELTAAFLKDETDREGAERIVNRAFNFEPVLAEVGEGIQVLELFHGPTCAFKDFGASFLASSMEEFLNEGKERAIILTATSGDTGSAVARAFYGKKNIDVVILYPSGRVSPLQEKQLTTLGGNIHALEVKGSFDDCQRMVKEAFGNASLKEEFSLSSANSINIGRLFPQSFYYVWARMQQGGENPVFCVPSGNFGNITAGLYAANWGLPVDHFVAATNANKVVPEFLENGVYSPRASVTTHSNAMDVGAPSNFERMEMLYNKDVANFRKQIHGDWVSDKETEETMSRIHKEYGYLMCPHTAVGYLAAERYRAKVGNKPVITLSTAHPGKFVEVVDDVLGIKPELPPELSSLLNKEKKAELVENKVEEIEAFLRRNF
ncbi:MAG: threonine synthase [Spirochaetales bacterium]|nr:threonine synthase [Spirochaetales bacterium]